MSDNDKPKNYEEMTPEDLFKESMELYDEFENLLFDEDAEVPEPEMRDIETIGSGGEYIKKQSSVSPNLEKYFAEPPLVEIGETLQHPKHGAGIVIEAKKLRGENLITLRFGNQNEMEISGTDKELTDYFNLKEAQEKGDVVTSPENPEEEMTVTEVLPDQKKVKVKTPTGEEKIVDKEFIQKKPVATLTKKAQVETLTFDDFWQIGAVPGVKSDVFNDFVRFVKNELPYINLSKCFGMTVHDLQEKGIFEVLSDAFNEWKSYSEEVPTIEPEVPVVPTPPIDEPEVEPEPIEEPMIGASKKTAAQDEPSKQPQKYAPEPQVAKNPDTAPKGKEEPQHQDAEQVNQPPVPGETEPKDVTSIADEIIVSLLMENPQAVIRKIIDLSKGRPDVMAKLDSLIPNPKIVPWHTASWREKHGKKFANMILAVIKRVEQKMNKRSIKSLSIRREWDASNVSYYAYGVVLGKSWGGGMLYYPARKYRNSDLEAMKNEIVEDFKSGGLDSGMGFERLTGAMMLIAEVIEKNINGKQFVSDEIIDSLVLGKIDEYEAKDMIYYFSKG